MAAGGFTVAPSLTKIRYVSSIPPSTRMPERESITARMAPCFVEAKIVSVIPAIIMNGPAVWRVTFGINAFGIGEKSESSLLIVQTPLG
jgi:hypothetical protein